MINATGWGKGMGNKSEIGKVMGNKSEKLV